MVLLELEAQLARLEAALGEGVRLVFVSGEAGVGKTALVRARGRPASPRRGRAPWASTWPTFDHVPAGNRYDLPPFYALHAWIWKPNPSGLFFYA